MADWFSAIYYLEIQMKTYLLKTKKYIYNIGFRYCREIEKVVESVSIVW
jgi:hypothetical protein